MKIQNRRRARDDIVKASQKMVSILGSLAEGSSSGGNQEALQQDGRVSRLPRSSI